MRMLLKFGLVISLLVVNVIAATPGSDCTIAGYDPTRIFLNIKGRVSANGKLCVPTSPVIFKYAELNKGLACGGSISTILYTAKAFCPY
jgi:hypothetical protein